MAVSASFIEGLLSTSEGDSNGGGSGDSNADADSGTGAGDSDAAGDAAATGSDKPGSASDLGAGAGGRTTEANQPGNEAAKQPGAAAGSEAALVAEAPKQSDDAVTQIGRLNGALRESRGEAKELKSQLATQAAQLAALQKQIEALAKPPAPEPEAEPDFLAEPKVYVDKTIAKTAEAVKKLEQAEIERAKQAEQQSEQAKKQEEMQQQWEEVLTKEAEFTAATPDYNQALQFVRGIRINAYSAEFEAINDRAPTQAEISKALTAQEIQGALLLQSKGKNPAQWYYDYAKKMGYKPVETIAETPAADPPKPAAKAPPPKPDKEAVKSMGSGGGGGKQEDDENANRDPMAALLGQVHGELTAKRKARRG